MSVVYVYGIVAAGLSLDGAPRGIENGPLWLEGAPADGSPELRLSALASQLEGAEYERETLEARVGDVGWIAPRATAHDAVLTWASDMGAVIPLPMFTLFSDTAAVRSMLRERAGELRATLARVAAGREYLVRLYRVDELIAQRVASWSPRLADLARQAEAATPGQRYLLERKAGEERAGEVRRMTAEVTGEMHGALAALALEAVREPLPPADRQPPGAGGTAVLDAAYLVAHESDGAFRQAVGALAARREPDGFRVDFTGPWPPYHFVREKR